MNKYYSIIYIYMGLFIAVGDYGPEQDSEFNENCLSFKKGDLIFLKNKIDNSTWVDTEPTWGQGFNITDIISVLNTTKGDGKIFPLNFINEKSQRPLPGLNGGAKKKKKRKKTKKKSKKRKSKKRKSNK